MIIKSPNWLQSAPRTKRNVGRGCAVLDQLRLELQEPILISRKLAIKIWELLELRPSGVLSPSRTARPSSPPKLERRSVDRLPSRNGTSMPPETASQHREPILAGANFTLSPAWTKVECPGGTDVDPIRTSDSPPHQAMILWSANRKSKPPRVISSPARDESFPTSEFATRNANGSSAPPNETPSSRKPVRPKS